MTHPLQRPHDRRPVVVLVVALAVLLLLLADLLGGGPITRLDPQVSLWFSQHRVVWLTALLFAVTQLHSTIGIECMLGAAAVALLITRRSRTALGLVLCVEGAMLLNVLLKTAFARARPDAGDALVHLMTYSFPSGHALASTVWWGCAVRLLLGEPGSRTRNAVLVATAAVLVALTCLSRVYLGAHYLSDVAAGFSEGVAWLAAAALVQRRLAARRALTTAP